MVTLAAVRAQPLGSTVRATGVVIAEAGRLGTPSLLAIGDATGGLVVHLPAGAGTYARGVNLEVTGILAAPYGQLEIRPARSDIRVLGPGILPPPIAVPASGLTEATEGRLATVTGRLVGKPKKTAGGDITVVFERDGGVAVKVMADASSQITTGLFQVGATYRVVGFVGQRASRAGALDGYRLWARDQADLVVAAPAGSPGSSATPGTGPGSRTPGASGPSGAAVAVSIARALGIKDRPVAIDAVVTAPGTLLDATGRRIVVQDGSGAIEILVPTGQMAPPVGARIHAEGRIGIAYGAPRLRADRLEARGTGSLPGAIVLHGSPTVVHEWRLVTVTGRVSMIHKLGTRWRAELLVGTQAVVIVGQPGSGIASTILVEGRTATVTGVARRPDPSAKDRRFVVTPRFPADLRQAGAPMVGVVGQPKDSSGPAATPRSGSVIATDGGDLQPKTTVDVDLVDLDRHLGDLVRVGGLVVDLRSDGFSLDDGTAIGRVALRDGALDLLSLIEPDDAINVIGHVETTTEGFVVTIDDPAGLIRTGDPVAATPTASADAGILPPASPDGRVDGSRLAGLGGEPFPGGAGVAGLGGLLAISAASLAVTLLRREQSRRRLAVRIAGRLATFAAPRSASADARVAERESSTIHPA